MQNLASIKTIKEIMEKHGISPSKGLGQNFLTDTSVCPRMAEMSGASGAGVIEIGPGLGVLTKELAQVAEKVVAVELDKKLIPVLGDTLYNFDNITVVNEDIMKVDVNNIINEYMPGLRVVICANLPYYITSPIIMMLLEQKLPIQSITVMVQREAAQRLCAEPGTRECGAVTASAAYYCLRRKLFDVPASSFYPRPKVDSAVIRLDILDNPPVQVADEKLFFSIIKSSFAQRRKTVLNSISAGIGISKQELATALDRANVPETQRAERLTLQDFAAIANAICGGADLR